jgi:hypothetical protein
MGLKKEIRRNYQGEPRDKSLGTTQLSNGVKIHISKSASISLSIRNPLSYVLWRAKKKVKG